jgi:hypothetical protein
MLAPMLDPRFKDLSILSSYMGIEKSTIVTTRYDFKPLIPLLYLAYQKFILLLNTHPILTLKVAIGDV